MARKMPSPSPLVAGIWFLFSGTSPARKISDLRKKLLLKCETHANLGDTGPYGSILECLAELRDSVRPKRVPSAKKEIAKFLKVILAGVYKRLEAHAIKGFEGIACMLYSELSGQASIDILKRLNTNCMSYEKAETKTGTVDRSKVWRVIDGNTRGFRGGRGTRGREPAGKRDLKDVRCYGCFQMGHYKNHCPTPDPNKDAPA